MLLMLVFSMFHYCGTSADDTALNSKSDGAPVIYKGNLIHLDSLFIQNRKCPGSNPTDALEVTL